MNRRLLPGLCALSVFTVLITLAYLTNYRETFVQLSEKPPRAGSQQKLPPQTGTLGLNIQTPYSAIRKALNETTAQPQIGEGEKQTCRKILLRRVCATLLWRYHIKKSGAITVEKHNDSARLAVPIALHATVSIDGNSAKLFGLTNKEVSARLLLTADIRTEMQNNWCPELRSDLDYHWLEEPTIRIAGNIKLNLRKSADTALRKKMAHIEKDLLGILDCTEFRQKISKQWRVHQIPLMLPDQSLSYIVFTPVSAHISNSRASADGLNITIGLEGTTVITDTPPPTAALELPDLVAATGAPGAVEFSTLIKLPYSTLTRLLSDRLVVPEPTADSNFNIRSVEVYPSGERLIFAVRFSSKTMSRFLTTNGELFISGIPRVDAKNNQLLFENVNYTRVIDNALFDAVSAVLHKRLLQSIQREAKVDLSRQLAKLEKSLIDSLSDSTRTGGLHIKASDPEIKVVAINAEQSALAVMIHLSTELSGTIPPDILLK